MEANQNNIFLDFQEKKKQVCQLAEAALKAGWVDEKAYKEIIDKIESDILTIGVIGQMKCGKSTFLNSFLFGKPLLPAATTPMTAALSIITYGKQKGLEAEFYTIDEWEELKALAGRDENEVSDAQTKSSIKAAKELYDKSAPIRSQLSTLLGRSKGDQFDNLIEYVGADGKYVSIVKSVRITLPEEWLKGVEIVDTPGFNDPVVSREERTKEFLKRADVVLMMLYAGRAFDATDRDILFDKVRKVGVGKVILAVNKYDIQLAQGESPEQIKGFVLDELRNAMRQHRDDSVSELLQDVDPVLVSAQMALLAKMPMSEISRDPDLKYHFDKACDDFELTTQAQLLDFSRIRELEEKVRNVITNQKEQILIQKPKNLILQKAKNGIEDIQTKLMSLNEQKSNLELPDDELEERIANLQKAQRRIERKIDHAEEELGEAYDEIATRVFRNIQDKADEVKDDCSRIIDQYKREELERKLKARIERFRERELPRSLENAGKEIKRSLTDKINDLADEVGGIITKYLDDDNIAEQFSLTLKKSLNDILSNGGQRKNGEEATNGEDDSMGFLETIGIILASPIAYPLCRIFESGRDDAREERDKFFGSIDWESFRNQLKRGKDKFIKALNGDAATALISGLVEQAEEAQEHKAEKEQKLQNVKNEIKELSAKKQSLETDYKRLESIV